MPGFPIRTSSDQRLIDNSPRLNAAFHVLHRLSMPRHPPCALNNEHTTNTTTNSTKGTNPNTASYRAGVNYTKHKRIKKLHTQTTMPTKSTIIWGCSRPLYSSHTTPQPPTTTTQQTMIASATRQHQDNNAPDTQQCTNIQTTLFLVQLCMDNVCHKAPFKHSACLLSVCFTRTIFQ